MGDFSVCLLPSFTIDNLLGQPVDLSLYQCAHGDKKRESIFDTSIAPEHSALCCWHDPSLELWGAVRFTQPDGQLVGMGDPAFCLYSPHGSPAHKALLHSQSTSITIRLEQVYLQGPFTCEGLTQACIANNHRCKLDHGTDREWDPGQKAPARRYEAFYTWQSWYCVARQRGFKCGDG